MVEMTIPISYLTLVPTNVDFSKIAFTKDGLLGQGGSSKVYAANYMYLEVAVKKFESVDPATAKQLYKEVSFLRYEKQLARILLNTRELRHPNIITMIGSCTSPEVLIVMELMRGICFLERL